ncbi:cell growth-regulating nucleolar protein-like [Myxocyprinus asiaticus]|uniref:cell growth-regulating nucleolar protein-like n=1 Tax=Myxocyprinus asiaticus TaxID=70543 RepID=UPI00222375A8|nr:cell growth-regulating nucleolar protein-like [Myxocyprinus asiaticus]
MVFFTCNACGESLKKAQVEKHVLMCRGCRVLSCIDCGKDFGGDDYRNHIKCISEDQKYGGKDFQAKANKGDMKQQQWIQRIQEAMNRPGVESRLRQVLDQVSSYDNVPRKRAKFQNWMKNSLKIHNLSLVEQVWEIFSSSASSDGSHQTNSEPDGSTESQTNLKNGADAELNEENNTSKREKKKHKRKNDISEQNGENTCDKQTRKKRKRQEKEEKMSKKSKQDEVDQSESLNPEGEESVNQEAESESNSRGKFNWKGTIKAVLRDAPDEGLAVKKLRKKVLAAYYSFSGDTNFRSEEELLSLFNKKINNNPKFKVLKDKVRLVK